mgnify:FL=1
MASINLVVNHKKEELHFVMKGVKSEEAVKKAIIIEGNEFDNSDKNSKLDITKVSVTAKLTSETSGKVELNIQAYLQARQRGGIKWLPIANSEISGVFDIKDTLRFDYGEYEFVGRRIDY